MAPRAARDSRLTEDPLAPQQDENSETRHASVERNTGMPDRPPQKVAATEARLQPGEQDAQSSGAATREEQISARPDSTASHARPAPDTRTTALNGEPRPDVGQFQANSADAAKPQSGPHPSHALSGPTASSPLSAPPGQHAAPTPASGDNAAAVPLAGLAVEISARARTGAQRFEIRLDPPELGRIDVRLDVHRDGRVTSHLIVDKVETLDLLRRDALDLERALQQAGLKTSDQSLQFSLRDQSFAGRDGGAEAEARADLVVADSELEVVTASPVYANGLRLGGGLDIHV
jgi:flagellar hook-length control protein FliK